MVLTIINVLQAAEEVAGWVLVPGLGALSLFSLVTFTSIHWLLLPPEVRSGVKVLQTIVDLLSDVFVCWVAVTCQTFQSINLLCLEKMVEIIIFKTQILGSEFRCYFVK